METVAQSIFQTCRRAMTAIYNTAALRRGGRLKKDAGGLRKKGRRPQIGVAVGPAKSFNDDQKG